MDVISALALEIDRTVLAVGTNAGTRHRETFLERTRGVDDDARRLLPRLAYFLLEGPIPRAFVSERIPYTAQAITQPAIDSMLAHGQLMASGNGDLAAGEPLIPALEIVVDGRVTMAEELWSGVAAVAEQVDELAAEIRRIVPVEAVVASRHVAIPEPEGELARLYERLTTIRYVRADAHRLAWQAAGLNGPLMVQLTTAWHGGEPTDVGLLEEAGWWDGSLSDEARNTRDLIEDRTNELNAHFLRDVDQDVVEQLLDALGGLPGTPVARPF